MQSCQYTTENLENFVVWVVEGKVLSEKLLSFFVEKAPGLCGMFAKLQYKLHRAHFSNSNAIRFFEKLSNLCVLLMCTFV